MNDTPREVTTRRDLVERGLDALPATTGGSIEVGSGGVRFTDMLQVMEFAKLMSTAGVAIRPHLRANPGACLAVTMQAIEWRMSPFAVASKHYEVNGQSAYESQLIHAVIEARAPLVGRLRCTYSGEGVERSIVVTGHIRGETEPLVYTSPKIRDIKPKNSPLWASDSDQQLWYYASRAWARKWCPDVLLGVYSEDEIERERPGDRAVPVDDAAAQLRDRLSQRAAEQSAEGFAPAAIESAINGEAEEQRDREESMPRADAPKDEPAPAEPEPAKEEPKPARSRKLKVVAPAASPDDNPPESVTKAKDYIEWALGWMQHCASAPDLGDWWKRQRANRKRFGVAFELLDRLEAARNQRAEELAS